MAIVTLDEIKKQLGITGNDKDAELQLYIDMLPQWLYDITGVWFGSLKTETEIQDYRPVVFLDNVYIKEVSQIKQGRITDETTDADLSEVHGYSVDSKTGRVTLSTTGYKDQYERTDYDQLHITYTYGLVDVPAAVKMAAILMVRGMMQEISSGGVTVTAERVGNYQKTYSVSKKEQTLLAPFVRFLV